MGKIQGRGGTRFSTKRTGGMSFWENIIICLHFLEKRDRIRVGGCSVRDKAKEA